MGSNKFCDKCKKILPVIQFSATLMETGPKPSVHYTEEKAPELCKDCEEELVKLMEPYVRLIKRKVPSMVKGSRDE